MEDDVERKENIIVYSIQSIGGSSLVGIGKVEALIRTSWYPNAFPGGRRIQQQQQQQDMINFLNMFPSQNGILRNLIPAEIILGTPNTNYNKLNITIWSYAQVYMWTTNSTKQSTVGAISLSPENKWGGYYFMYLATRKQLHYFIWMELPINDQVIQRVIDLKQLEMTKGYPIFE